MHLRLRGLLAHLGAPPPAVLGLYMQLISSACVTVMSLVAKVAGSIGLPVFEIVLARSLVLLVMSGAMLARRGAAAEWPWRSERRLLLLVRGMLGFGAVSCLYWAVQYLPLGDTAVLTFLAPVFVAAAAPLVLGERAGKGVALAMPLCVAGVVMVAQPEFLFGAGAQALSAVGVAIGIGQAVFSAAAKLCIRALGSTEPVASIIFAMAGVSTVGSTLFCALLPGHFVVPRSAAAWGLLLAAGLLGCGVQLLATTALKLSKAAPTIAMSYTAVVWGLLLDLAVYHQAPPFLSLVGAALVCASSFVIVRFEACSKEALPPMGLKAKDSARLELAADSHWQHLEAGVGGAASLRAAGGDAEAFILEGAQAAGVPMEEVTWVKNADEAHQYLETGERDVVLMSYDDTLSITLGDGFNATAIAWPVHGGMLSLCGSVDPASNRTTVGIDTTTGYARALRYHLSTSLAPEEYEALNWVKAGATNIRYQALLDGQLDATLLNPPFTILVEAQGLTCTPMADVLGPYQGVVAHVTQDFLADAANVACLQALADASAAVVAGMRSNPAAAVAALTTFYSTTSDTAAAIYDALWQPNGLASGLCFNTSQLAGTEAIYAWDTQQEVPADRTWVQDIFC